VARSYGGTLALIAFLTVVLRGWAHGSATETTLLTAWLCLLAAFPLGCVIGGLGDWIVLESIRGKLAAELADREAKDSASPSKTNP
jgi:hypothetical protein